MWVCGASKRHTGIKGLELGREDWRELLLEFCAQQHEDRVNVQVILYEADARRMTKAEVIILATKLISAGVSGS